MRLLDIERDDDGLPKVSAREHRVAVAVVLVATVFFALAATWEIAGPLLAGHYASSASMGIIAENMVKWRIPGPVWEYTASRPGPDAYYCHHPWGIFWTTALLMKLFGRHDVVCRLAPVLLSTATPPLLFALGRSLWRPIAGAAAALAFVVLPISLAFAQFNALEVPLMAWTLLGLLGYVRFLHTWRRRHALLALVGFTLALHTDWPAFVLVAELLAFMLVRQFLLPRRVFGPVRERRHAALWIALASSAALTLALYLALFLQAGKLADFLGSGTLRSSGQNLPLAAVLASRRYWIELCFTPVAVALGKLAALVCLARLVANRREIEAIPLFYLGMAVFQYVVFKQGADVHVFWPHTFAAYFALAIGALVATLTSLAPRRPPFPRRADGARLTADSLHPTSDGAPWTADSLRRRADGVPFTPDAPHRRADGVPFTPEALHPPADDVPLAADAPHRTSDGVPLTPEALHPDSDGVPLTPEALHPRSDGWLTRLTRLTRLARRGWGHLARLLQRARPTPQRAPFVVLALTLAPLALILRDALPALVYARGTGGRFNENGRLIDSDGAATAFLRWLAPRLPPAMPVDLHEGMKPTWAQAWALGDRPIGIRRPLPRSAPEPGQAPYLVDTRFLLDDAQADLAARYRVVAVGSFWQVDRTTTAPIEAFSFRESEPSLLTWYLVSGTEPVRAIVPDPLLTWELRAHFAQPLAPADPPALPPGPPAATAPDPAPSALSLANLAALTPATFDQRRILHNLAVATGNRPRAAALAAEIEATLTPLHARFDDGSELVGARFDDGACPQLTLVLRAAGPTAKDVQLTVKSRVTARAPLSTTLPDPTEREVGLPLPIAPERWKPGFLYTDVIAIRRRPGREVFAASFWSRRHGPFPHPIDARKSVEVLALP